MWMLLKPVGTAKCKGLWMSHLPKISSIGHRKRCDLSKWNGQLKWNPMEQLRIIILNQTTSKVQWTSRWLIQKFHIYLVGLTSRHMSPSTHSSLQALVSMLNFLINYIWRITLLILLVVLKTASRLNILARMDHHLFFLCSWVGKENQSMLISILCNLELGRIRTMSLCLLHK